MVNTSNKIECIFKPHWHTAFTKHLNAGVSLFYLGVRKIYELIVDHRLYYEVRKMLFKMKRNQVILCFGPHPQWHSRLLLA